MLGQRGLPSFIRAKILEYVDEKSAGTYGHGGPQFRRFANARVSANKSSAVRCLSRTGQQRGIKTFRALPGRREPPDRVCDSEHGEIGKLLRFGLQKFRPPQLSGLTIE